MAVHLFKNLRENISGMWELCMVQWEMKNLNLTEESLCVE